jgi:3-oxochol-4-en-24-oyl-CoA dehydrogenase
MAIAITDDHLELQRVARSFLDRHDARWAARALLDAPDEALPPFWDELVGLGWLGLHLPEEHGGSGFGLLELAVVLGELGRAVAPGPFLPTVCASAVVDLAGDDEQRRRLLPRLASGERLAAVGLDRPVRRDPDGRLVGEAGAVVGAGLAHELLIVADDDLVIVDAADPAVTVTPGANLDPTRRAAWVSLQGVSVGEADILVGARATAVAVTRLLAAAEAVGGAAACVEMAVGYAKVREQFGRPIGMFQAVKHYCADMLVAAELATAAVWDAVRTPPGGDELLLAGALAATQAFSAFLRNAQTNIQVHGGIGYTWEHDGHLLLRRAGALAAAFGGDAAADDVRRLVAAGVQRLATIDLPPEADRVRDQVRPVADRLRALPPDAQRRELIDTGYAQPHWPEPFGRAAGAVEQIVIDEELAGIERPSYGIGTWIILTLIQHGTEDQVARWVRPSLEGDLVWCQLFSEPEAGSDAAAVRTRATPTDGGWLVTGQKVWTSGAQACNRGFATVRTDAKAAKHEGITMMVIDMRAPGVEVRPLREATGNAAFNEVFLESVFVPDEDVVGPVGGGWKVARSTLGNERVSIGSGVFGLEGGLDLVGLARAIEAGRYGATGSTALAAAHDAGRLLAERQAMVALNLRSAQRAVVGGEPGPEGNVAKLLAAEHAQRVADLALRLAGPSALFADGDPPVAHALLYTRCLTIAGGTSEITRNQIGERILGLPRDPLIQ